LYLDFDFVKSRFRCDFDFVLFSHYEAQVEALLSGFVDVAWNDSVAHVRVKKRTNFESLSLGMRHVDRDALTHVVTPKTVRTRDARSLSGKRIAAGAFDSPQSYIIPFLGLEREGVDLCTLEVIRFDTDPAGKHGEAALGEFEVMRALKDGMADAGFVSDAAWKRAMADGSAHGLEVADDSIRLPRFDSHQFDALSSLSSEKLKSFLSALYSLNSGNTMHRTALHQLGGFEKNCFVPARGGVHGRKDGYDLVFDALQREGNQPPYAPLHSLENHPFQSLLIVSQDSHGGTRMKSSSEHPWLHKYLRNEPSVA